MKGERGILEKKTEARHHRRKGLGPENKCVVVSEEVPSECGDSGLAEVLMGLYPPEVSNPGFVQGIPKDAAVILRYFDSCGPLDKGESVQ
jgi:hypothetical protein